MELTTSTTAKRAIIDITDQINELIARESGSKLCVVTVLHTTCAITTADLDPGTDEDLIDFLHAITPNLNWKHPHDPSHAPDHLLASLIGPSVSVPLKDRQLHLGPWQRVVLVELAGPRDRKLQITCL